MPKACQIFSACHNDAFNAHPDKRICVSANVARLPDLRGAADRSCKKVCTAGNKLRFLCCQ
jgi:hypothetical protein